MWRRLGRSTAFVAFTIIAISASTLVVTRQMEDDPATAHEVQRVAAVPLIDLEYPCGPTSVAVASRLLGGSLSLAEAVQRVPVDYLGRTSIGELVTALVSLGCYAVPVHMTLDDIQYLDAPVILHLNSGHFVVATHGDDGSLLICDPPQVPTRVNDTSVRRTFSGAAIIVHSDQAVVAQCMSAIGLR